MRIILFTGKGGVGKTCASAATALRVAQQGRPTVVLSTDRAHSLGDALQTKLSGDPQTIRPHLEAFEVDVMHEVEEHWGELQQHFQTLFAAEGLSPILAEEIAILPGLEELSALFRIKDLADRGAHEVIIVDCAPTGATLRLLSLPEVMNWYIRRVFPVQRAVLRVAKPIVDRVIGAPVAPGPEVFATMKALYDRLDGIKELLCDPSKTTVRLVSLAERMAVEETKRAFNEVSLYGLSVEAVIVNRLLPQDADAPYLQGMREAQGRYLEDLRESFAPLPILEAPQLPEELLGVPALERFADALYPQGDPARVMSDQQPVRVESGEDGLRLLVRMPFGSRGDVHLVQRGEELVVEVGSSRRNLLLPGPLARRRVGRAHLAEGLLSVEFEDGRPGERE